MSTEPLRHESESTLRPLAIGLTVLAGALVMLFRIIPHPFNLTPMGGMGIFAGCKLRGWKAGALPIALMVASDVVLWIYAGFDSRYLFHSSRIYVYASLLLYVGVGRLLRDRASPLNLVGASLLGSLQFFLITNFCAWLLQPFDTLDGVPAAFVYSRDLSGILMCFAAGLPFFQGESPLSMHVILGGDPRYSAVYNVVGDLFFTFGLFVLHGALARAAFPAERPAAQPSVPLTQD
jgi:hypothetical protein